MKNVPSSSDIKRAVRAYTDYLVSRGRSPATVNHQGHCLEAFAAYLDSYASVTRVQDVNVALLGGYRRYMIGRGLAPSTRNAHLYAVRGLFAFLEERGAVFENPAARIRIFEKPPSLPRVLTEKQVRTLLYWPNTRRPIGLRNRAIFELLYGTGMRRRELLRLAVGDVDALLGIAKVHGKGSKDRVVPMGRNAVKWLQRYLTDARPRLCGDGTRCSDALWLTRQGRPMAACTLGALFRACRLATGLAVSPHTLRRSCVTHMLDHGASPAALAELLGHSRLDVLGRYLRVSIVALRKAHAATCVGS